MCLYGYSEGFFSGLRGAGGGRTSTASWRLWSKRSERNNRLLAVTALSYCAKRGAERPQVSDRSARRGGKSLAVELP